MRQTSEPDRAMLNPRVSGESRKDRRGEKAPAELKQPLPITKGPIFCWCSMSDDLLQFLPASLRAYVSPEHADDSVSLIQALEFHLRLQKYLGSPAMAVEPQGRQA